MPKSPVKALKIIFLSIILLTTFLLGIKQIYPFKSVDEIMISDFLWNLHQNPFPVNFYPPFFLYLNFVLSLVYKSIFMLLGIVSTSSQFISGIGLPFTLQAGRILNAFLAVFLVFTVYKIGKEFYTESVAFFASLLLAFNNLLILHAHIFKSDVILSLFTTVSFYFIFKYLKTRDIRFLIFASFLYGLAVGTKFNIFIFILVIILAVLLTVKELDGKKKIKLLILIPIFSAAGFFLGAPNWLVNPVENLKLFIGSYGFGSDSVFEHYRFYNPSQIYGKFISTFIHDFGMVFFILFLLSILINILNRSKKELLFIAYILLYIFMFGFMGFYGDRFCLPLYPVMAILVGKTIFIDLKKICSRRQKIWKYITVFIWLGTALFSFSAIKSNIKSFNQLETKPKSNWAQEYRFHHHIDPIRFNVAFQQNTPRIKKGLKLNPLFKLVRIRPNKNQVIHFIQAVLQYHREYMKNFPKNKKNHTIDFSKYKTFYTVQKLKFQPWDYDYIFLYRISPELLKLKTEKPPSPVYLPRSFYENKHTSFFPLQVYEKNPAFGKIKNGEEYIHYLYSKKKMEKILFYFFSPEKQMLLSLKINRMSQMVRIKKAVIVPVELSNIQPKKFFFDFVYQIRIKPNTKEIPCYFVFHPVYSHDTEEGNLPERNPMKMNEAKIPEIFSVEKYPDWVKDFYRNTGIDLSLLKFINQNPIFSNMEKILDDISLDFFPLQKGCYRMKVTGGKIIEKHPLGNDAVLSYSLFSSQGAVKKSIQLNRETISGHDLEVTEPIGFIKIEIKNPRENNFFIQSIGMDIDYKRSIDKQAEVNDEPNS